MTNMGTQMSLRLPKEKLKPSLLKKFRVDLLQKQGGLSALTGLPILEGEACLDHQHFGEGLVRGVISRAENTALGKIENGYRYGKSFDVLAFAKGLHWYLTEVETDVVHPLHGKSRPGKDYRK